jgi:hypothetical protein
VCEFKARLLGDSACVPAPSGVVQREAYDWFTTELANLRTAFRRAADRGDLDVAAPIATYAAWVGFLTENHEPIASAEELIEPARAVDHPRLAALYVVASNCFVAGRIDPAIRYTDAPERAIGDGSDHVPYAAEATGNPFVVSWAVSAYGLAVHDADPVGSLAALRRGLAIAQDSGIRFVESTSAYEVARLEAEHGDPLAALDLLTVAIGNYHD